MGDTACRLKALAAFFNTPDWFPSTNSNDRHPTRPSSDLLGFPHTCADRHVDRHTYTWQTYTQIKINLLIFHTKYFDHILFPSPPLFLGHLHFPIPPALNLSLSLLNKNGKKISKANKTIKITPRTRTQIPPSQDLEIYVEEEVEKKFFFKSQG